MSNENKSIAVIVDTLPRTGKRVAIGMIPVSTLIPLYNVARRDHFSQSGYQREPTPSRVNKLVTAIEKDRVDLPTAILLNVREFNEEAQLTVDDHGADQFSLKECAVYVVDGQHRVEALKKLFEADEERWADYRIPFVCMLGATELEEMEQFYVVNSNAKSVPTTLAYDLLKQRAENSPSVMEELLESGKAWIVTAQSITEIIAQTGTWQGRIRFPREPKASTTIQNSGFVNSLRPLLASSYFGQIGVDNQVKILNAYWDGIRRAIPDAFVDPADYTVQKSIGVAIMHHILTNILEIIRSKNGSVLNPDEYVEVISAALNDLEEISASGERVTGARFWMSGPDGAAGMFSSSAGRRVLLARIRQRLPEIAVR